MAKIELEIAYNKSINRETRILGVGDDLYYVSQEMEQYKGYTISEIDPLRSTVTLLNGEVIKAGGGRCFRKGYALHSDSVKRFCRILKKKKS